MEETGVALLPGSAFGRPEDEFTARLAYVDFDGNEALSVSNTITNNDNLNIDDLGKTTEFLKSGINSLVHWLK